MHFITVITVRASIDIMTACVTSQTSITRGKCDELWQHVQTCATPFCQSVTWTWPLPAEWDRFVLRGFLWNYSELV